MTIALICPSRGRPEKMLRMWNSARSTASSSDNIQIYLGVDKDEEPLYYQRIAHEKTILGLYPVKDWGVVMTVNLMVIEAMKAGHSMFMVAADDTIFSTPEWDKALLDHYAALENKIHVYSLLDSRDENGTPHPIATREYVKALDYFSTPIFMHWFADIWMTEIAKANNCFTHMKDYLLIHDKPSDKGLADSTHTRIRERGWLDRDRYVHSHSEHLLVAEKAKLAAAIDARMGKAA